MPCSKYAVCVLGLIVSVNMGCADEELRTVVTPNFSNPELAEVSLTEPSDRVDIYQQVDAQVDILWVVDNTRSMMHQRAKVAENIKAFTALMDQTRISYQMGVTSTDMGPEGLQGALNGVQLFIDAHTTNAVAVFSEAIDLEETSVALEEPLAATLAAISEPMISGPNKGFIRPEAGLFVIAVSDVDDGSFGPSEYYVRAIRSVKGAGNEGMVHFSAIAGDVPDGCFPPGMETVFGAQARPARRLMSVVEATGGEFESVCVDDFLPALTRLGISVAGLKRVFPLNRVPLEETIRVYVDQHEIRADRERGWEYLADVHSIFFGGVYVPESGAVVEVHYKIDLGF